MEFMKSITLSGLAIVSSILLSSCGTNPSTGSEPTTEVQKNAGVVNIQAADFDRVKLDENAIVLDVRTPEEVNEGIIEGATVFADYKSSDFAKEVEKLDKSKTYIVYCRSGGRSLAASEYLISQGFQHIYNLEGGISNWPGKIVMP